MSDGVKKLAYLFRASNRIRPVLLLGAGASFRSGIPLAEEAVRRIAKAAYARNKFGLGLRDSRITLSDWLPYLQCQRWFIQDESRFAENFPLAVENFLTPREFRREFFHDMVQSSQGPSEGYKALARMMVRRLVGTVLTTNFDPLICEALREQTPKPPLIIEIKTPDDLVTFGLGKDFQIVYMHGSIEHYRDKNLTNETLLLDERLVQRVRPLLSESPIIVAGYRGAEPSIMHHLLREGIHESGGYHCGLYWCVRKGEDLHDNVKKLEQELGSNFVRVEIEGFDELMLALDTELEKESWYAGTLGLSNTLSPVAAFQNRFDLEPLKGKTLQDLDHDSILSTLSGYAKRLKLPEINKDNYLVFLERQGFLCKCGGELIPSAGCFLLFGIDVQKQFQYALVSFTQDEKSRVVIGGNLISQFRKLLDILSSDEVNPRLRLKTERAAEEQNAYPPRALTEITVNLLVHRDYEANDYSRIDFKRGRSLTFANPGGLMPSISQGVRPDGLGRFKPVRGLTEMRNPLLADIFFGIGSMDKAGSGLADVRDMAQEFGGQAECAVGAENKSVQVSLLQPVQDAPERSRVARPISKTELYVTNILPFRVLPKQVYFLPLRKHFVDAPLFDTEDDTREMPLVVKHSGMLLSFANFGDFPRFTDRRGYLERLESHACDDLLKQPDRRNLFVWLLNKHWDFFLRKWPLIIDGKRKRAFFRLTGKDSTTIPYLSKMGRRISRDVVKKRGEEPNISFEHEALHYSVTEFFGAWALQFRPSYVFTRRDAETPLGRLAQTRRATRRFKFDRNPSVDNDLVFWARYLSQGEPTISLGNVGVSDLILDSEFLSAEVPKVGTEENRIETAN